MRGGVVAAAEALVQVELVGGFELVQVELDAQARLVGHPDLAGLDPQRLLGEALDALLPDPVRVQRGVCPRARPRRPG